MKTAKEIEAEQNYRCVEILHKKHDYPFEGFEIVNAMKEFGKEQYNQGILDLLDKSDGLDMNFQASKLFKNKQ